MMNQNIKTVVDKLLNDPVFISDCEERIKDIMKDKKVDFKDTPHILSLVVLAVDRYDNIKIKKENVVETFKFLIIELLKKLELYDDCKDEIEDMLDACLKLLVLKVKTNSLLTKLNCCKK